MKRAERHHLKEDELRRLAFQARDAYTGHQREVTWIAVALVVLAIAGAGYYLWRQNVESKAHGMLAQAIAVQDAPILVPGGLPNPGAYPTERARIEAAVAKFKATADAYPGTDTGLFARYQEAAAQLALGNATAAVTAFQDVVNRAGDRIYGQMARLGVAEAQARAGQYDQAINAFKELAQLKDGPLPVDGILMHLGRTYREAGKRADAQQTFNRLVEEFPESPFTPEAKRELDTLNKATS